MIPEIKVWFSDVVLDEVPEEFTVQSTTAPFRLGQMPAPPRGRDHVTMTFLPAPGSVDVAEKVWMCQLTGNTWPLRKELAEICEWKVIEDESRGYIRESPVYREVAGADFLKALHAVVQVVFTKVEVSSDLGGVVQAFIKECLQK